MIRFRFRVCQLQPLRLAAAGILLLSVNCGHAQGIGSDINAETCGLSLARLDHNLSQIPYGYARRLSSLASEARHFSRCVEEQGEDYTYGGTQWFCTKVLPTMRHPQRFLTETEASYKARVKRSPPVRRPLSYNNLTGGINGLQRAIEPFVESTRGELRRYRSNCPSKERAAKTPSIDLMVERRPVDPSIERLQRLVLRVGRLEWSKASAVPDMFRTHIKEAVEYERSSWFAEKYPKRPGSTFKRDVSSTSAIDSLLAKELNRAAFVPHQVDLHDVDHGYGGDLEPFNGSRNLFKRALQQPRAKTVRHFYEGFLFPVFDVVSDDGSIASKIDFNVVEIVDGRRETLLDFIELILNTQVRVDNTAIMVTVVGWARSRHELAGLRENIIARGGLNARHLRCEAPWQNFCKPTAEGQRLLDERGIVWPPSFVKAQLN